jgi:serine/threonine protein kinase
LGYFLSHPVDQQFNEVGILWRAWSLCSTALCFSAFEDEQVLYQAHLMDIRSMREILLRGLSKISGVYAEGVGRKIRDIEMVVGLFQARDIAPSAAIISHSDLEYVKELGFGNYAVVKLAKLRPSNELVAVKELKAVQLSSRNLLNLKRELHALLALRHPNLLSCVGVTVTPPFCILTRYLPAGSLYQALKEQRNVSPNERMQYAVGIARGLEYLSVRRYVHRDLKSHNILLDDNGDAVIADMGMARAIGRNMSTELGTIQWAAPEVMEMGPGNYNCSADTYSFGILLWEILTCAIPYGMRRPPLTSFLVCRKQDRPEIPEDAPPNYVEMMVGCWAQNAEERWKIEAARERLESGTANLTGTNAKEFADWVAATRPEHERVIATARASAAREEHRVLDQVHNVTPLDVTALIVLHELGRLDFPFSERLLIDLFRLTNQSLALDVQSCAFDLLKKLAVRGDPSGEWTDERILLFAYPLFATHPPNYVVLARLLAGGVDIEKTIAHFLSLPRAAATGDLFEALMIPNSGCVSMETVLRVFGSLEGTRAASFFRFMIETFGPRPEFLSVALANVQHIALFCRKLSRLDDLDLVRVSGVIGIPDVPGVSRSQALEGVAAALANDDTEVSESAAVLILKFIVENCLRYDIYDPLVQYLLVCSRDDTVRQEMGKVDVWRHLESKFDRDRDSVLQLLRRVPLPGLEYGQRFLDRLLEVFVAAPSLDIAETIAAVLRQYEDLQIDSLVSLIVESVKGSQPLFGLVMASGICERGYEKIAVDDFWCVLGGHLKQRQPEVVEALGKLVGRLLEFEKAFPFDPEFFATMLNVIYAPDIPFSLSKHLIAVLVKACAHREVFVFLGKRHFGEYLIQLPWIYPDDAMGVMDIIGKSAALFGQYAIE